MKYVSLSMCLLPILTPATFAHDGKGGESQIPLLIEDMFHEIKANCLARGAGDAQRTKDVWGKFERHNSEALLEVREIRRTLDLKFEAMAENNARDTLSEKGRVAAASWFQARSTMVEQTRRASEKTSDSDTRKACEQLERVITQPPYLNAGQKALAEARELEEKISKEFP